MPIESDGVIAVAPGLLLEIALMVILSRVIVGRFGDHRLYFLP